MNYEHPPLNTLVPLDDEGYVVVPALEELPERNSNPLGLRCGKCCHTFSFEAVGYTCYEPRCPILKLTGGASA